MTKSWYFLTRKVPWAWLCGRFWSSSMKRLTTVWSVWSVLWKASERCFDGRPYAAWLLRGAGEGGMEEAKCKVAATSKKVWILWVSDWSSESCWGRRVVIRKWKQSQDNSYSSDWVRIKHGERCQIIWHKPSLFPGKDKENLLTHRAVFWLPDDLDNYKEHGLWSHLELSLNAALLFATCIIIGKILIWVWVSSSIKWR